MKNKLILVLVATLLTVSVIGCGSKEKQTAGVADNKAPVSANEDVEIKKDYGEDIMNYLIHLPLLLIQYLIIGLQ